ncbi:MAG TPA: bifunctional folylpolyglutamate synthase/dihydrofolate synthase, partial [Chloroflexi bacterium]|nr:bifunctional folylpolyglutamate synthase/dihydrofolate synthase [Chloroflexota bacterium]
AAGYRVGAHVSPYLQVATEKLQIDGRLISAGRYERLVDDMHRSVDEWVAAGRERPNYGEIWVAMTLRYFAEEQVDVAVVEVGAGGRFDVTNVLEPDVVAITSVGLDHTVTLGSTLEEIAWHKAGIIKPGSVAVTAVTGPETLPIIEEECRQTGADLVVVREGERYRDVRADADGTSFIDGATDEAMRITLPGTFQASNAAMAIEIARRFTHGHLP